MIRLSSATWIAAAMSNDRIPPNQPRLDQQRSELPVQNVAVLGATGSIGTATASVLSHLNQIDPLSRWRLWAASGHQNLDELHRVASEAVAEGNGPEQLIFSDPDAVSPDQAAVRFGDLDWPNSELPDSELPDSEGSGKRYQFGPDALVEAASAPEVDVVVAAIVGRAGLESTIAAVEAGKRVALANKETLVVAGGLVTEKLKASSARLMPVDSEHSAIWQCLSEHEDGGCLSGSEHLPGSKYLSKPKKLILTASGGPFRTASLDDMRNATPEDALNHPTWQMGRKITIDSATMMNKALEIIEARWLFDVPAEQIEVVVHPQSIIHSMVEFEDGSVLAQMSPPDMKLPIQYALTYPRRLPCNSPDFQAQQPWNLTLEPADLDRFPALGLGFEVARSGGTAGAVVNAANEVAVGLFLAGEIRFTDIVSVCRNVLENHNFDAHPTLTQLLDLDHWARTEADRCAAGIQSH